MDTTETLLKRFFGVIARGQTYLNLLHVLLAFPLGLFYFVFLVTGLSVGIGTIIIWVGLAILALVLGAWWMFILFERQLASGLLKVKLDPIDTPKTQSAQTLWKKISAYLSNPVTWKGLLYLFLKFPLGILIFVVVVASFTVTLAFLTAPLTYQFFPLEVWFTFTSYWSINTLSDAMLAFVAGLPMLFVCLHLVNGLAWISGWLAKVLLGNPQLVDNSATQSQEVQVEMAGEEALQVTETNTESDESQATVPEDKQ
jgi:hypothetical protein